tara:strand:- start:92 stop:439 length:348 start_codon:yes stop_codon:yes gene_type:complete
MHLLNILTAERWFDMTDMSDMSESFDMTLAAIGDSLIRQSKAIPVIGIASTAAKQRTTTTISNVFNILFSVQRPLSSGKHESLILNTLTTGIFYVLLVDYFQATLKSINVPLLIT